MESRGKIGLPNPDIDNFERIENFGGYYQPIYETSRTTGERYSRRAYLLMQGQNEAVCSVPQYDAPQLILNENDLYQTAGYPP